jgi:SAM-dependent methyltransferase
MSPYEWLLDSLPLDTTLLDLACGSAPLAAQARSSYVGIDRSRRELELAHHRLSGTATRTVVQANATSLPFPDRSFDLIASSMALMVMTPLDQVFRELARVATPHGRLALLLPASAPVSAEDLWWYGATKVVTGALRFATPPTGATSKILEAAARSGFVLRSRLRERFEIPLRSLEDTNLLVHSWYLPTTSPSQQHRARRALRYAVGRSIGIPLERITLAMAEPVP